MLKRWLKKREFTVYYFLSIVAKDSGDNCFNEEVIVELVASFIGSKRVARNVVRHLVKQGLLERRAPLNYCVRNPDEVFRDVVVKYIASRLSRLGFNVSVLDGRKIVVLASSYEECNKLHRLEELGFVICKVQSSSS